MDLERRADSTFEKENLLRDAMMTPELKVIILTKYKTRREIYQFCELGEDARQPYHHCRR